MRKMKEIDFYPLIAEKFKKDLSTRLQACNYSLEFSYKPFLPDQVKELSSKLDVKLFGDDHIPGIKTDILMAVKSEKTKRHVLTLFEVKYSASLTLMDFSQLAGYLQVAKKIRYGLLCLVEKGPSSPALSGDFSDFIRLHSLSLDWRLFFDRLSGKQFSFKVGICRMIPNDGVKWVRTEHVNGIVGYEGLIDEIHSVVGK